MTVCVPLPVLKMPTHQCKPGYMREACKSSYAVRTALSRSWSLLWELTIAAPVPVAATPDVARTPGDIGAAADPPIGAAVAVPGGMGAPGPDVVMVGAGGGGGGGGAVRGISEP